MKKIMKWLKLDRWLADGAPAFWVLGMSIVILGAALGILSALFLLFDWQILKVAISWVIGALVASLVGCVLWFVVDALTAKERPTTWRK
jgi:multisubunit Na+/H+ antiporter MnhB subunit